MKIKILIVDPDGRERTERIEDVIGVRLKRCKDHDYLEVDFNSSMKVRYPDGSVRDEKCVKTRPILIWNENSCKIKIEV